LLRSFELAVALLQDAEALERATRELVESKAADNRKRRSARKDCQYPDEQALTRPD
jgi:hypothetical protein